MQVFGLRTLQVIDESPSFLKEVKGLGPRRIQRIRESWKQQRAVRDIMVFLQSHGVGTARRRGRAYDAVRPSRAAPRRSGRAERRSGYAGRHSLTGRTWRADRVAAGSRAAGASSAANGQCADSCCTSAGPGPGANCSGGSGTGTAPH